MKILWHSVAPWVGTGYGSQTAQATQQLQRLGHDVAISAYYGLQGAKWNWKGILCYPSYAANYGNDVLVTHAMNHFGAAPGEDVYTVLQKGLAILLGDVWTFRAPLLPDLNLAAWTPIDHETLPPLVEEWFQQSGAIPIAMSRFGERKLTETGFNPLYVPHAIDTSIFRPGDQAEARERVGLPKDAFVVAMVAANVGKDGARKAFYEQILAFRHLRAKHSDVVLALHTDLNNPHGVELNELLDDLPAGAWIATDQYEYRVGVPATTVADVYRAADVLTNTSWGEGFGLPIIEAQACGIPVIVTNTTAMPELCGAGWTVSGEPFWHNGQRAWARRPLIGGIVEAYEAAYRHARDPELKELAWGFAQAYDVDYVADEFWRPALAKLEQALTDRRTAIRPKSKPRIVEYDGLYWLQRGLGTGDALAGDHEQELWSIVEPLLPEGGVFLDIGAHVGHYALRLADKASRVIAVEANPAAVAVLKKNIAFNDLGATVEILPMAAWDDDTVLVLDDPRHQDAGGSTRTIEAADGVKVPANALDEVLLPELDRLDLVKIDVEGADLHVLRGMRKILDTLRPTIFLECHDLYGYYEREDLERTLTDLGYGWEIAQSILTTWQPGGLADKPQQADWLICRPMEA